MLVNPAQHQIPMGSFFPSNPSSNLVLPNNDAIWSDRSFPRPHARSVGTQYGGLSYAQHEVLRQRKTPQGVRVEEVDLGVQEDNTYGPAPKHILLSPSSRTTQATIRRGFLGNPRAGNHGRVNSDSMHTFHPKQPQGAPYEHANYPPAWEFPAAMDSVLNQGTNPSFSQRAFYNPRSNVPTVLPGSFQSTVGPTASAGQQYYGPYWPDGTFTPYRPASIRSEYTPDLRQSQYFPEVDYLSTFQNERPLQPPHQVRPGFSASGSFQNTFPSTAMDSMQRPRPKVFASFHDRIQALNVNDKSQIQPSGTLPLSTYLSSMPNRHTGGILSQPTSAAERFAFRDKSFAWAHGVYVDLLAHIQRENRVSKQYSGQYKSHSKPSIFPRPPQRTRSHFSEQGSSATIKRLGTDVFRNLSQDGYRPQTAIRSTSQRTSDFMVPAKSYPSQPSPFSLPDTVGAWNEHDARKVTGPADPFGALPHIQTPATLAISALDSIEQLCQEAESPWMDGMLLAGCLAYGLSNYGIAMTWYQRVLQQDPTHVEAISNLAATLLAVGKREEALQNWQKAVRLRPSYFEAVEHLIGLLCQAQRPREAVDTITYMQNCLKLSPIGAQTELLSDGESDDQSRHSSSTLASSDLPYHEYDFERRQSRASVDLRSDPQTSGSFGYAIPAADNGRLLALIHAKGNMLYALGEHRGAAEAFEEAILVATGEHKNGIRGLIDNILRAYATNLSLPHITSSRVRSEEPLLLDPDRASETAQRLFPPSGQLPGLEFVPTEMAYNAAVSTASNSLLSLAKIYQDGLSSRHNADTRRSTGTREILALYYLSLSLQPSPSTANNVGILLAGVQNTVATQVLPQRAQHLLIDHSGIVPGSGIDLALMYYNYGLKLDGKHAHLYTNLGSLLKDLGQLPTAIKMYETAVSCDGNFDIALANLANAVKDQGRIREAIEYYKRAVQANPDFAEAVCGLATALNSICNWYERGGIYADNGDRDRVHVDEKGMMYTARKGGSGWMNKVVNIVEQQLLQGEKWGMGSLTDTTIDQLSQQLVLVYNHERLDLQAKRQSRIAQSLRSWRGQKWEGSRIVRLIERAVRLIGWQWYRDRYVLKKELPDRKYVRPHLPASLSIPNAPTVLPFHTFTTPLSAKQVRQISQRNALRISVSTLRSPWLPRTVYPPPAPPARYLKVGYVSSDFNNHPLAHLMQSIFGLHNRDRVRAYCYATTPSDNSVHRLQIERESPVFYDASSWNVEKLVNQIVQDGIHILVNLNGYTRGARNEVFAARPAPIHMSFMGFAGTLGAEWCDYVYADEISITSNTLAPWRRNVDIEDKLHPVSQVEDAEDWIYAENVIFSRSSFFCVDHKQSAPDAKGGPPPLHNKVLREQAWRNEQDRRWKLRKELFPQISDNTVIFGNFNQLYKIDPATFRMYLRILNAVPNSILWLLRFPDAGEQNLKQFAKDWAGPEVASRIVFTDVAPKGTHITRASIVDLFLDTPECNAHTTAADVIWSGTPIVTWARWDYKMCSRMASSIVASALPEGPAGDVARAELLVASEREYEYHAIDLASDLLYPGSQVPTPELRGRGKGRLMNIRRILWEGRWTSRLFDTKRWVQNLEEAYWKAWEKWERGEGGDIWL